MGEGHVAVVHAAPSGPAGRHWGDRHYAESLAGALARIGLTATPLAWDQRSVATSASAVVTLRGLRSYEPPPGVRSLLWVISHPDLVTDGELDAYDHVCVASGSAAARFRIRTRTPVHVLHQATDLTRFKPPGTAPTNATSGVVVVANHRWPGRRGPRWLRQLGVDFRLYGRGWDNTPEARFVVSPQVPNDCLAGIYATADVVVADQWTQMARAGFVANRLFDVAAAGGFCLSDDGAGVGEMFGGRVPTWGSREQLGTQVTRWLADPLARHRWARELMDVVRSTHGFEHRASSVRELLF